MQSKKEAEATLSKYREPLLGAAYDLQSRLYNILRQDFLGKYYTAGDAKQRDYAVRNTLYLVGQYFAWTEILRQRIQFLDFGAVAETREVGRLQDGIRDHFASDQAELGRHFMVWRGEQRAIGEIMIDAQGNGDDALCMGYASFMGQTEATFWSWFQPLEADLEALSHAPTERLKLLQHALIELIERLDAQRVRFPERLERA